ncbi:MAG: glycosyltransferase family 39 protein [Chloroflexota bacterium]|nr:glycosyltransferase family 39 protein [Chloroflexota bacterium]
MHKLTLPIILVVFVVLALIYAWATPVFEASDELWHFGMIQHIAETGQLPVQQPGVETIYEQEGSQPPLYYLMGALLISPIDRSDFDVVRAANPHVKAGIPGALDNKNLVLRTTPHPPLTGTVMAVMTARLFSIALGVVTIAAVYASARLVAPTRSGVALLAAGLTAFNPMFLFITASVNNDNLVTALNSLVIWQLLVLLRDGFDTRRSVLIAVLIALASLSKLSGNVLIPVVALTAIWVAWQRRDWRGLVTLGMLMAGVWAVTSGWWYVRNFMLYGELFGTSTMVAVAGGRPTAFDLGVLLREFEGFRIAYWGLFGAVNVLTFDAFYRIMDIITLLAVIGMGRWLWQQRGQRDALARVIPLVAIIAIGAVSVIVWTSQTLASQGRLLFPFVAASSPLLALGLTTIGVLKLNRRDTEKNHPSAIWAPLRFALPSTAVVLLAVFATIVPFASIAPAYAAPQPLAALPESARPVFAQYGSVTLIGYETPNARYQPGATLPVTLYWQVNTPSERNDSLYITAFAGNTEVGKVDSYPGGGRLQTTRWQAGEIYADSYAIELTGAGQIGALRLQVGWWHYPTETVIAPVDADGQSLEAVLLDAGGYINAAASPVIDNPTPTNATFGDAIALEGYRLDGGDTLMLRWHAMGTLPEDYTVFVQVLDAAGQIIGQGDAPPPLHTRFWRAGDRISSTHTINYSADLESGTYRVFIGWYRPSDFMRLSVAAPDNAFLLTEFIIP